MSLPLIERKACLSGILDDSCELIVSMFIEEEGQSYFAEAIKHGFEGVMAKRKESRYLPGKRSRNWLKFKQRQTAVCYIVGYREGADGTSELLWAQKADGKWVFRGNVELGFSPRMISLFKDVDVVGLAELFTGSRSKKIHWIEPVPCEVTYQELTPSGYFKDSCFQETVGGIESLNVPRTSI